MTGNWWADTISLLGQDFIQLALVSAALLGVISGVIAPLIIARNLSFASHASAELALFGASAALLFGFNLNAGATLGAIAATVLFTILGNKFQDATVSVVLTFGMGLSVLFLFLYPGRSSTAMSLLTGQVIGGGNLDSLKTLIILSGITLSLVVLLWRPLIFSATDPTIAGAMGVKVTALSIVMAVLMGAIVSQGVQLVGALLIMSLTVTPGASAVQLTNNPKTAVILSIIFAEIAAVGGIILSLAPGWPVSVFITTLSFVIFLVAKLVAFLGYGADEQTRLAQRRQQRKHSETRPTVS